MKYKVMYTARADYDRNSEAGYYAEQKSAL